jgi:hypothetical protein
LKKHVASDPDPIDSTSKLVAVLQDRFNQTDRHSTLPSEQSNKHQVIILEQKPISGQYTSQTLDLLHLSEGNSFIFTPNKVISKSDFGNPNGVVQLNPKIKTETIVRFCTLAYPIEKFVHEKSVTPQILKKLEGYLELKDMVFIFKIKIVIF